MEYVVIWFFCGTISALLASNKNRNTKVWFIIGFLFGPIGVLVAFFMQDLKEIEEEQKKKLAQSSKDRIFSENSYHYEIEQTKGISVSDEWQKIKQSMFKLLKGDYKAQQNDAEIVLLEVSKASYIKMEKIEKEDENGSIALYFSIDSVKCGYLEFDDDLKVVVSKKIK
jgi:hypothetical protein